MSVTFSNLPLSSILHKKSKRLKFYIKINNQLVSVTFKSDQTVKSLKMLIERKFQIPSKFHFLMMNQNLLKDLDIIEYKITENSIISLNFRLLGGMIDPPYSAPLHGLEVILLDNASNPISGTFFDPSNNPKNLPSDLVCRIYSDFGCGTGFGIKTNGGETLIITAKHVVGNQFGQATLIAACFEHDQTMFGRLILENLYNGLHNCRQSIQELRVVDFDFSGYDQMQYPQKDLITDQLYSIHDDIVALRPTGKCICGAQNQIPTIGHLKFSPTPDRGSLIVLLGYPGIFTNKSKVFSVNVSNADFMSAKKSFRSDTAMYTEGEVLNHGIISCISASSVGGMSGSPMLYYDQSEWKIGGMLVGGPAVYGHRKLLNILGAFNTNDRSACEFLITEMINPHVKRSILMALKLLQSYPLLPDLVHDMYFREIQEESFELLENSLNPKDLLNHNLVYDCFRFIDQLVNRF